MRNFVQQRALFKERAKHQPSSEGETPAKKQQQQKLLRSHPPAQVVNLYEEMRVMCELSALIYTVAYLLKVDGERANWQPPSWFSSWWSKYQKPDMLHKRELVLDTECPIDGEGSVGDCHSKLKRKLPAKDVLEFIDANQEVLSQDPEITGDAPEGDIHPRTLLVSSALENVKMNQDGSLLWHFDHHFGRKDLVYGITVNRALCRVTIIFRGSTIRRDWWQNAKVTMATLPTPPLLKEELGFEGKMKVHTGFLHYLLDDDVAQKDLTYEEMKKMNRKRPGKYGQILEDLEDIYTYEEGGKRIHEGFQLYVTGHSLGAALSTLLAMKLSCSWIVHNMIQVPMPIINVSVASPYVGNRSFADATSKLEDAHWLRHIRLTNKGDIIPVSPPKRLLYGAVYEPYIHTGINVHLTDDDGDDEQQRHVIGFGLDRTFASQFTLSSSSRHAVADYWIRKDTGRTMFEKLTIEQVYKDQKKPLKKKEDTAPVPQAETTENAEF